MSGLIEPLHALYEESSHTKVSDKWSLYLDVYERALAPYRMQPVRLLEIGVQNGGSLARWATYFKCGERFVGCDVDPLCGRLVYDDPRIRVVVGDAGEAATAAQVLDIETTFDIVIDDGSHRSDDICRAMARYLPHVRDGGIYIVEDLHCSYWAYFGGGLHDPHSSISFFKALADVVNHEHWGVERSTSSLLQPFFEHHGFVLDERTLARVHSVEFANSMCMLRIDGPAANVLGHRVISGVIEDVAPGHLGANGGDATRTDQSANPWAHEDLAAKLARETRLLRRQLDDASSTIVELTEQRSRRDAEFASLEKRLAEAVLDASELRSRVDSALEHAAAAKRALDINWAVRVSRVVRRALGG